MTILSDAEKAKIDQFKEILLQNLRAILELGYEITVEQILESKAHRYWFSIEFSNYKIDRCLNVSFFPYDHTGGDIDDITMSITKTNYRTVDDFIALNLLLEKRHEGFESQILKSSFYNGSFAERMESMTKNLVNYLMTDCLDILKGEHWEIGLYPRWD